MTQTTQHPESRNDILCSDRPTLPLIGDPAPAFIAETTQGIVHFPEDFAGSWTILFSHPADFTPVCTTEFMMFAELAEKFEALNTRLLGLSVDSLSSHIAWLYTIHEQVKFRGMERIQIPFPLIADLSQTIARKYGMIHPGASNTKTVRAVFFIDPMGIIRTILYYPASTGRNFDEIMRILVSLQTADAFGVSTPADWRPGDDVIRTSPGTLTEAQQAAEKNAGTTDVWFLSLESLPVETITGELMGNDRPKAGKSRGKAKKSAAKKRPK